MFRRLEELQVRQEACEARLRENADRLEADESWQRKHEQEAKDAFQALILARGGLEAERPVTADGASGDVPAVRPGRPKLRVILGGLAVAATAALIPAAAAAGAHHAPLRHHASAARVHRRDPDPSATMGA